MKRAYLAAAVALALGASAGTSQAADLFWQGGAGNLSDSNYTDGTTTGMAPTSADNLYIGASGTANSAADQSLGRLFVGHNAATDPGAGTVNVTAGTLQTAGAAGKGGVVVGSGSSGTLNVNTAGTISNGRLINIGYGDDAGASATLNVGPGGTITSAAGDLVIGSGAGGTHGITGHYNQTGGSVSLTNNVHVGQLNADGSSFSLTGGTFNCAQFTEVDNDTTVGSPSNVTVDVGGDATLNQTAGKNFFVGLGSSSTNVVLNLSGTATLNAGSRFLMGAVVSPNDAAHNIVVNQTGGTLNTQLNLSVADQGGYGTYNFSNGVINTSTVTPTASVVGRQGTGRFIQTGGTANFVGGLTIGNINGDADALLPNGLYEISAGTLAPSATGTAVNIGQAGTGMLHVIGGDSTITVTGAFIDSSTASGNGTLSYTLQAGEPLTEINVTGDATFAAGSILAFDLGGVAPSQSSYDLLTATTITDSGLTFDNSAAPGWGFQIVSGGNGQVLQAITVPEPASLGLLAGAGLLALRRRRRA
jgi:hypothetical protein